MVYIRNKRVKGINYAYLVESTWDKKKQISKQKTVKYLGKSKKLTLEDIPEEYKSNQNVIKFLSKQNNESINYSDLIEKTRKDIFTKLAGQTPVNSSIIYDEYKDYFTITEFYDKIMKQILYDVGNLWEKNKLMIGTEHVISNRLLGVINELNQLQNRKKNKTKLLICNPAGEKHNIVCNILESILINKGYNVYNISPSTPSEDILKYVRNIQPDLILMSITLNANLSSGIKLVKNITKEYNIPILVGGQAITAEQSKMFFPAKIITKDTTFDNSLKQIRNLCQIH